MLKKLSYFSIDHPKMVIFFGSFCAIDRVIFLHLWRCLGNIYAPRLYECISAIAQKR
jgi:hypothetical protein